MYAVEATITFHLTNLQLPNLYSLESRARAGFVFNHRVVSLDVLKDHRLLRSLFASTVMRPLRTSAVPELGVRAPTSCCGASRVDIHASWRVEARTMRRTCS